MNKLFNFFKNKKIFLSALILSIFIFSSIFYYLNQAKNTTTDLNTASNLPYNEKIADGVWQLKNREPVHQVLASEKQSLDLKESNGNYKWGVSNANGTKFYFGKKTNEGILPIVHIVNKDDYFIEYSPKDFKGTVTPKVNKNVISWEIADGITARYTMMADRVKADYIVDSKEALCNKDLAGGFFLGSAKSNIGQQKNNQKKSEENLGIDTNIYNIHNSDFSSNLNAISKDNVAKTKSTVNVETLSKLEKPVAGKVINNAPIHPAAKLVKSPERTLSLDGFRNILIPQAYASETDPVKNLSCASPRLEFDVITGNNSLSASQGPTLQGATLQGELMPGGDIEWYSEALGDTGPITTHFTFPAPIVKDSAISNQQSAISSEYQFEKTGDGQYSLAIVLDPDQVATATWPLTIDPVVIDSTATITGTAYGAARLLLRDAWGNLIILIYAGGTDDVWTKNYNATTWVDRDINLDNASGLSDRGVAGDIDSYGNVYGSIWGATNGKVIVVKLTISRNSNNEITGINRGTEMQFGASSREGRPSLFIANKGGGAGVEKIVFVHAMNIPSGGTVRGDLRIAQCDVADECATADNWKNMSEEKNGGGTCSTATSGAVGIPNSATCYGTTNVLFQTGVSHTTHIATIQQMPGKPKRSPASVKKDINGTFTTLSNTIDNNTGTTDDINSLTTTDYIYVGDDKPFSKVSFDVTDTNSSAATFATTTVEYCSAQSSGTCTTWTDLSNFIDNSATATIALSEDGSILFDESTNWVTATVDSVASKYWIRLRPAGAFDASVSIAEVYLTDRNSRAMIAVGGAGDTTNLGAAYVPWDEIGNAGWENNPASAGEPWRSNNTAVDSVGGAYDVFTNLPLTSVIDYKNNMMYVAYVSGTVVGSSNIVIKGISTTADPTVAANWYDTSFPTVTEAADIVLSLTSDGADIYLFYVLDPEVNSLVWRKCTPSGGGNGNYCDNASDWGSEKTLDNSTDVSHPQAVVTKVTGDTIAIDTIYTMPTALDVVYERHYADLADKTITVAVGSDDAYHLDCDSGTDDQYILDMGGEVLGRRVAYSSCDSSADSESHWGIRFQNIPVNQGALIASAYFDFYIKSDPNTGDLNFTIYGEDVDDSVTFSDLTNCTDPCSGAVGERTRTTSSEDYAIDFKTIRYRLDVTDIIQEIVCRGASSAQPCVGNFNSSGSWVSGNDLSLLLISTEGGGSDNAVWPNGQEDEFNLIPTLQINLGETGKKYSMGNETQLATGSGTLAVADFDHPLSSVEYGAVATDDSNYASVSATTNYASQSAQPAFMFKVNNSNNNNTYAIDASAIVKSTLPATSNPIHMQIYRGGSTDNWVNVVSNTSSAVDTDIGLDMTAILTNLSEYYFNETPGIGTRYAECTDGTANCWVYFRIFQEAPSANLNEILMVDYFNVTFSQAGGAELPPVIRGGTRLRGGVRIK